MNLELKNRRVLVTGSTRGIGEAIAKVFAAEGAQVVIHGRDEKRAAEAVQEIRSQGGSAERVVGDLADNQEAAQVAQSACEAFGGIDILVNNAGVFRPRGWWNTTPEDWLDIYNRNVVSTVRLIKALVPTMKDRGWGRVIQISSGMALLPNATMADYAATKIANALTSVSLSLELAGSGVTVNTVSPGPIQTPGSDDFFDELSHASQASKADLVNGFLSQLTVKRMGLPQDVADAVVFLASEKASYINGVNLRVDGGYVKML